MATKVCDACDRNMLHVIYIYNINVCDVNSNNHVNPKCMPNASKYVHVGIKYIKTKKTKMANG